MRMISTLVFRYAKSGKKIFISFDLVRRSLPSQARCASSPRGRAKGLVQGFDNCVIVDNRQSRTPVPTGRTMEGREE